MEDCISRPAWAKKVVRPHLKRKKLDMVVRTCHPSNHRKHKIGGSWSRLAWAKSVSKIARAKRTDSSG
jgi:hypothetical protein